jgi:type IV secretory pathway TraG/TraD family ATPase VirD4
VGLLEDVREAAYQRAAAAINAGSTPYPTVLLALDEVANVAPLPDLPDIVSEGGGQGLVMLACLQDLSQARARWGQEADGFGSLFGAIVVFRGINDVHTLQALSARCGEMDVPLRSESRGRSARSGSSRSVTWTTRRQPRLSVDEIAEGHAGCALVIGGADPARWVGLAPWWSVEPWRTLARGRPHLERPLGRAR